MSSCWSPRRDQSQGWVDRYNAQSPLVWPSVSMVTPLWVVLLVLASPASPLAQSLLDPSFDQFFPASSAPFSHQRPPQPHPSPGEQSPPPPARWRTHSTSHNLLVMRKKTVEVTWIFMAPAPGTRARAGGSLSPCRPSSPSTTPWL